MRKKINRPFFFTNFVSTLDGKVQVFDHESNYWPIGSEKDFDLLLDLRAQSDLLIHGKGTAIGFRHLDRLASEPFKQKRAKFKKPDFLPYMVISSSPDDSLLPFLKNPPEKKAFLITTEKDKVNPKLKEYVDILRFGEAKVDLEKLVEYLYEQGYKRILVEGGPTLVGSFLEKGFIDEIYLTIAPKIFGNLPAKTLTLIEGVLFPPEKIKHLKLLSVKKEKDELYLRYKVLPEKV